MGYEYGFKHNTAYSADDVNSVFSKLFTGGTLPYEVNVTKDIMGCIGAVTTDGIIGTGMSVIYDSITSTLNITKGTGLFSDGSWISIDADGYSCAFVLGEAKYVGFVKNLQNGLVSEIVSSEKLDNNETELYLWLAFISSDGTITSQKSFAQTNLIPNEANHYWSKEYVEQLIRKESTCVEKIIGLDNLYNYAIIQIGTGTLQAAKLVDGLMVSCYDGSINIGVLKEGRTYSIITSLSGSGSAYRNFSVVLA